MRFFAFTLITLAAFDWPLPWLDRAGTALFGFALLSLTVGRLYPSRRPTLPFSVPTTRTVVADEAARGDGDLAARLAPYIGDE